MSRGLFIVIEGTDGSGKGTQSKLLVDRLISEGKTVEQISFPQYGERSCTMVEDYLNGKFGTADEVGPYRASVFYAMDRFAASKQIQGWLDEGTIVIANRYVGSNMGHQGGKITDAAERSKYFEWNHHLEYELFGIPKPDLNIILHVTPEISQALVDKKEARTYIEGKKRDIHEDDLNHLRHAEQAYLDMANRFSEFTLVECVEGGVLLSVEDVAERVWKIVKLLNC